VTDNNPRRSVIYMCDGASSLTLRDSELSYNDAHGSVSDIGAYGGPDVAIPEVGGEDTGSGDTGDGGASDGGSVDGGASDGGAVDGGGKHGCDSTGSVPAGWLVLLAAGVATMGVAGEPWSDLALEPSGLVPALRGPPCRGRTDLPGRPGRYSMAPYQKVRSTLGDEPQMEMPPPLSERCSCTGPPCHCVLSAVCASTRACQSLLKERAFVSMVA